MAKTILDGIWGSFAGLAIGDALGMPFHELTPDEIRVRCNGLATDFYKIFEDEFIHLDYQAGQVTDDTTLTVVTARSILKYHGKISSEQFIAELASWVRDNQEIWQHGNVYGPSTKVAFSNYLTEKFDAHLEKKRSWCYAGTSNGALMRVSPAGWAKPGNWREAVELACNVILPTHPTDVALSAAASLAAAVSQALCSGVTINSIIEVALQGARLGEEIGAQTARKTSQRYPLPNLEWALEIATKSQDVFATAEKIRRTIGSHFHVAETLATSIGIFYSAKGDYKSAIIAAVNNGGDSDTIASIVGALCGAFSGITAIPREWVSKIEETNHLDCEAMANEFSMMVNNCCN